MFTLFLFFFFNDTATTEIYTLSLHDALPICQPLRQYHLLLVAAAEVARAHRRVRRADTGPLNEPTGDRDLGRVSERSEEHTSELQSRQYLVCRLLLEKKKKTTDKNVNNHTKQ